MNRAIHNPYDDLNSIKSNHKPKHRRWKKRESASVPNLDATWSDRAKVVARWFNVPPDALQPSAVTVPDALATAPSPRTITLLAGPSGAGKSTLLRRLHESWGTRFDVIDCAQIHWTGGLVIDQFGPHVEEALQLLSRFGLAEAHTYLRPPAQLSDGQQWRLRLACAMHRAAQLQSLAPAAVSLAAGDSSVDGSTDHTPMTCGVATVIVADEFTATLDRLTAFVVARALRRAVSNSANVAAIVATSHEDVAEPLSPDVVVRCDFGRASVETGHVKHET